MTKPHLLIILDGWGYREESQNNGILNAKTPHFDRLWKDYPHTLIEASGPAVGLPEGIMGNSEVGHMNLGAGRIVFTGLSQIYKAIDNGEFFKNKALRQAIQSAKENKSALHLMGLLSDGAVHSHQDHLYALLKLARQEGLEKVYVHAFMDGRDTPPQEGLVYIQALEKKMKEIGVGELASISGRFYAMDRDQRWERIEKVYNVMLGISHKGESSAETIVKKSYRLDKGDEFIQPQLILNEEGTALAFLEDKDAVIFFNFRPDRAREITYALTQENFNGFKREKIAKLSSFVCMSTYDDKLDLPIAFESSFPTETFGEIISKQNLKQLRISETEKYAHVTYFFSGGAEKEFEGEERILVPSPREVATYDLKPEMSAWELTRIIKDRLSEKRDDVIIVNFANPDMVGHTAKPEAIQKAVETVDQCLGEIVDLALQKEACLCVTADHGNAEQLVDSEGNPHTAHTINPVPFMLISQEHKTAKLLEKGGRLCDVAPTLLDLMKIEKPDSMMGQSLIVSSN